VVTEPRRGCPGRPPGTRVPAPTAAPQTKELPTMGYGIGGILVLVLIILAIIFFAKRV
jgi:hypothetical protein